MTITISFE